MSTKCSTQGTLFPGVAGRDAVVQFNAGDVTSNGGSLLLECADWGRHSETGPFGTLKRDPRRRMPGEVLPVV
jgi:hypothetical protein